MQALDIALLSRALNDNYVLVLTTNSHERKAVAAVLNPSAKANIRIENDGARLGVCGEHLILHLTGTSGGQADKAIGRITRRMLSDHRMPKPKAVIFVGIAWGAPEVCNVGDVVLSGEILAVNQLRFEGGQLRHIPISRTSPWVTELADISAELASLLKTAKVGVLASGEQFLAADAARDALLTAFPQIMGGEMEAWDLVPDLQGIPWIQVRGICDFASTGLTRFHQIAAAESAAEFLSPLIASLRARGRLPEIRRDPATVGLLEVLAGEAIHIANPCDEMSFDNHLNYRIGPSLIWRVAQYGLGVPPTASLPRLLTDLLLEMGQNAIKHGGATIAKVQFGAGSVTYTDDGQPFDLFKLADNPNGRGGREALVEVLGRLVREHYIGLTAEPQRSLGANRYRFSFPMLSAQMRETKEKCSVEIHFGEESRFNASERLIYDPACNLLFFDASELMMYSRRFDVVESLQAITDSGRDLIIKCDNAREKAFYEDSLVVPDDRKLTVIVAPMALFNG